MKVGYNMKKFIKVCEYILLILFLILIPFMRDKLSILLTLPVLVLIYFLSKKINIKHFTIFIFIMALVIRIISIIYLKVSIVDDFKTMLDASRDLITGNLDFLKNSYFEYFPYQLGHVLYQALLLKIINSVFFLKIINSIITALIVVFIYLISKNIVKEKTAKVTTVLYLLYFYPLYLNSVLTNQHLPVLLSLIGIYLLITKKSSIKTILLIAVIFGIANIFRTESIIFIGGIILYILFITKDKIKQKIILSITLLGTYLLFNILVSSIIYISPLHTRLENNAKEWKFYCGLSTKYNGIYNEEDQEVFFNSNNRKGLLKDRIKQEGKNLPVLFLKKEVILWTQTNYDLRLENNINEYFLYFNQGYLNVIIILFIISLIPIKKISNDKSLLIKIILAMYYGIYMFIEISPRYAYILHVLIFILIGVGIENINKFYYNKTK